MMRLKEWFVIAFFSVTLFAACQPHGREDVAAGKVTINLVVEATAAVGSLSRSGLTELEKPDWEEFTLLLLREEEEVLRWERLGDWGTEIELPVGSYRAVAYCGNERAEGFLVPYFRGEEQIHVVAGESQQFTVNCSLAQAILTFEYSDTFMRYFSHHLTTVESALGSSISVEAEESGFLYLLPGALSISMDLSRQSSSANDEPVRLVVVQDAVVKAQTHYNFRFDVDAGGEMLEISFDDQVVMQPIDLATLQAAPPKFTLTGVEQGGLLTHAEWEDRELTALLSAKSGIKNIQLRIASTYLESLGVPPTKFSLTDPAHSATVALLQQCGLELRGLAPLNQMVWFDFSKLVANLQCMGSGEHLFEVSVVDRIGKSCEPLQFAIQSVIHPISVTQLTTQVWNLGDKQLSLNLETPGDAAKVKAFLIEESGERELSLSTQLLSSNHYQLLVNLPGSVGVAQLRFQLGSSHSQLQVTPVIPHFQLVLTHERSVWAKHAQLKLVASDAETEANLLNHLTLMAHGAPLSYSLAGSVIKVEGLLPATTYLITPWCVGLEQTASSLTITTEQALQLPNGNMEEWHYTRPSGVKYWEVWQVAKEGETPLWNTLNAKTTSEGGTNTGMFAGSNRNGCRYNANSGTIQTTDAHTGSSAALIRAVGWGRGNSAVGSANSKYGDPGYLYLGSYNESLQLPNNDGIPFAARPSSLSYYYKYAPGKGGDSYLAQIILLSKVGEEVVELGGAAVQGAQEVSSYELVELPIHYNEAAFHHPVTHLHLLFKSGDRGDNGSFVTVPSFGNLSSDEFVGSQLYIDDIKLNYE
ncbi:MAG: DUF4493 domain-containing protein [Phocaeicola sp.]